MTPFILLPQASERHLMGGKARALAQLQEADFPVPAWFVVSPEGFQASLSKAQREALPSCQSPNEIRDLLKTVQPSADLCQELEGALAELMPEGGRVAVRSSAVDEDGAQHSFAGQLDSFLFVKPEDVAARVADVWRSGFSERVLAYRHEAGLPLVPTAPSVLVQHMVNAESSGVAFSADPVSGRRGVALVSAVWGLGTALVSGESDADTFFVDRQGRILERDVAAKPLAHVQDDAAAEGVSSRPVAPEKVSAPALEDDQVRQVAELARQTERFFGRPQDIEWAFEDGKLYLLQARPVTSLYALSDPEAALGIWDNSNIVESYGGVTTPLTFSFARHAYEGVYRELLRILGVSKRVRLEQETTFKHMLGLIQGRIYYNLLSWYKLLATLPGFQVNRAFMEDMMGVKEGLPDEVLSTLARPDWRGKLRDGFNLAGATLKLVWAYRTLPGDTEAFYARLGRALSEPDVPLSDMRADELAAHYRDLETRLLTRWDAPLVNDFFAMIFYGLLQKLCEAWCGDADGTLQNDLISGEGDIISAEPAERVRELARLASGEGAFATLLIQGSLPAIRKAMHGHTDFKDAYEAYLDKFGDRCLEELKLESSTLHDDPLLLLRSVGTLAQHPARLRATPSEGNTPRTKAERRVAAALNNPVRRTLFSWVLNQARLRVRERENLRFERTRLFGHVRKIFLELGKRFYALDVLDEPRDIFYLEVDEALGFVEGISTLTDLKGLVALRKAEFEGYREERAPAERFETRGVVYRGHDYQGKAKDEPSTVQTGDTRSGTGCCPGVVRARVRVVTDPRDAGLQVGEILVAERTDPGWIMLFPAASGLLVERGSLLSHSAIVAREMGIPAVVTVPEVTRWLKSGDFVEFDGSTGVVRKLEPGTLRTDTAEAERV